MLVCFASLLVCRTIVETVTIIAFPVRIIVQLHRLERFISWCPTLMALTANCVLACTLLVVKLQYYVGESWHNIAFLIQHMRVHKLVKFEAFQLVCDGLALANILDKGPWLVAILQQNRVGQVHHTPQQVAVCSS